MENGDRAVLGECRATSPPVAFSGTCGRRSFSRLTFPVLLLTALAGLPGCTTFRARPATVPTWELANAEPYEPIRLGRARVSFDRPLPAHLVQDLSPEFALITVRTETDWAGLRRRLRLPQEPPAVDLSQGVIVGILARVGESAGEAWPIRLRYVRCMAGEGCVEATFTPGLYYPVLTAGYVEFAYAPGLRTVSLVHINHRKFAIRLQDDLH